MTCSSKKLDLDACLQCILSIYVKQHFFILSHLRSVLKGFCVFFDVFLILAMLLFFGQNCQFMKKTFFEKGTPNFMNLVTPNLLYLRTPNFLYLVTPNLLYLVTPNFLYLVTPNILYLLTPNLLYLVPPNFLYLVTPSFADSN